MSTEEQNKAIAEFCGAIAIPDMWPEDWFFYDCSKIMNMLPAQEPDVTILCAKDFRYHSSWDWLMPAWQKFRDLRIRDCKRELTHHQNCNIIISFIVNDNTPERAAKHLSEAIQWLNTQNK